jgi:hypothetical protein
MVAELIDSVRTDGIRSVPFMIEQSKEQLDDLKESMFIKFKTTFQPITFMKKLMANRKINPFEASIYLFSYLKNWISIMMAKLNLLI